MKIGDLVRSRLGKHGVGIIIDTYWNNTKGDYSEMRVKWFSERALGGTDPGGRAWFLTRDLEILSENR